MLLNRKYEIDMIRRIRRLKVVIILGVAVLLFLTLFALSYSEIGVICGVGSGGLPPSLSDLPAVPQSIVDDANRLATELFGDYKEGCDDFVNQLLATYLEAKDEDFVIVFNTGGWGWDSLEATQGWQSITTGIEAELASLGYESLSLSYQRTAKTLRAQLKEGMEMATNYPSKAKDLASRIDFLTTNIPDLKVIITGESNGSVISDSVMSILEDNPRVYSIQTGPPFWHRSIKAERTLVVDDNGIVPDSFSQGDFVNIIVGNLKALFGLSKPEDESGTIFYHVRAPGHDYWWQYPKVYSQITDFLQQNFGFEW